jgi:hypothetical protein
MFTITAIGLIRQKKSLQSIRGFANDARLVIGSGSEHWFANNHACSHSRNFGNHIYDGSFGNSKGGRDRRL